MDDLSHLVSFKQPTSENQEDSFKADIEDINKQEFEADEQGNKNFD